MKKRYLFCISIVLIAGLLAPLAGQSSEANTGRRERGGASEGAGQPSPSFPGSNPGVSSIPSPSPSGTASPSGASDARIGSRRGYPSGSGGGVSGGVSYDDIFRSYWRRNEQLVRSYPWADYDNLRRSQGFFTRLWYDFGVIPHDDYLVKYAHGDAFLTPDLLAIALKEPSQASRSILKGTAQLRKLIDRREAGELSLKDFQDQFEDQLSEIRKEAKTIRKNYYLDYVDQNPDLDLENAERPPASLSALRSMVEELEGEARRVSRRMRALGESTRVVNLSDLQEPSFKSLSKRIDRLSKDLEKTAESL